MADEVGDVVAALAASVFGQELFLLQLHSAGHAGLEGHYHWLLQLVVAASLVTTAASAVLPRSFAVAVVRSASVLLQGVGFVVMGFALWVPGARAGRVPRRGGKRGNGNAERGGVRDGGGGAEGGGDGQPAVQLGARRRVGRHSVPVPQGGLLPVLGLHAASDAAQRRCHRRRGCAAAAEACLSCRRARVEKSCSVLTDHLFACLG